MDLNTPISERFIGLQHLKEIYLSKLDQNITFVRRLIDILLKHASSVVFCDTGNNQIIGTIPEILSKLRKLETLWLGALFLNCIVSLAKIEY